MPKYNVKYARKMVEYGSVIVEAVSPAEAEEKFLDNIIHLSEGGDLRYLGEDNAEATLIEEDNKT